MGKYINQIDGTPMGSSFASKCSVLIEKGAQVIDKEELKYQEDLVCVVDNGFFGAAAYVYDQEEFDAFQPTKTDMRLRAWFKFENAAMYVD